MKGLSITYALATGLLDAEAVARLVAEMRRLALRLLFERVGPVVEVVRPHPLVCVPIWPGQGCEPAAFGFCKLPPMDRWRWSYSCCVQHASRPEHGGLENFLRCHQALTALLDAIQGAGLAEVEVRDDGGYWERRDEEKLVEAVQAWNDSDMTFPENERRRPAP
jgi:hypothetical protein